MIYNPQALARMRHGGSASRQFFGGGSSSKNESSSTQNYTDARQTNLSDSHNSTQNNDYNVSDSHAVSNSGNSSWAQSTSNSGNSSWMQALSNSGNSASYRSDSSTSVDARNTTDSHNVQSTVTNIGTDAGAIHIAQMQTQLMGAVGEQNVDAVKTLARMGTSIGGNAYELAALSQGNSMALSSHMLDLTGELIDKLATGTGNAVAENAAIAQATAAQASAQGSTAGMQRLAIIGGGVLLAALILKK